MQHQLKSAPDSTVTEQLHYLEYLRLPPSAYVHNNNNFLCMQEYITAFQYNHTANTYFDQNKQRPLCRILSTARDIVRQGLPIKCVEAVFLALLLTAGWNDLDRIPVGFKTCVAGHVYRCCPDHYSATVVGASLPSLCPLFARNFATAISSWLSMQHHKQQQPWSAVTQLLTDSVPCCQDCKVHHNSFRCGLAGVLSLITHAGGIA